MVGRATHAHSWKDEYRVVSYYWHKIRSNKIVPWQEVANLSDEPVPPQELDEIAPNHFKYTPQNAVPGEARGVWQSTLPLYPHPVGTFNVAYFEVELISESIRTTEPLFYIGVALERYFGTPGTGRNSYSYSDNGSINTGISFAQISAPKYGKGDTVGCGVNFTNKFVFFTKNGQIVSEKSQDHYGRPLLNLKSLHASIRFQIEDCEMKFNFGATPFMFDILRYKRSSIESRTEKIMLYSSVLQSHLLHYSDQETYEVFLKTASQLQFGGTADFNPLPLDIQELTTFQSLVFHNSDPRGLLDPDLRIEHNYNAHFVLGYDLWESHKTDPHVLTISNLYLSTREGPANEIPEDQKLTEANNIARIRHINGLLQVIEVTIGELLTTAFTESSMDYWAMVMLAFYAFLKYPHVPLNQFWKQILMEHLLRAFHVVDAYLTPPYTEHHYRLILGLFPMYLMRVQVVTLIQVIERKNLLKSELRQNQMNEAKNIYVSSEFDKLAQQFLETIPKSGPPDPTDRRLLLALSLKYHNDRPTILSTKVKAIIHGLLELKFDPTLFNTATAETDWYTETRKALEFSENEGIKQYLKDSLAGFKNIPHEELQRLLAERRVDELYILFNFQVPTTNNARHVILKFFEEEVKKLDQSSEKMDSVQKNSVTTQVPPRTFLKTILLSVASIGIIATIGGVFWIRSKNRSK